MNPSSSEHYVEYAAAMLAQDSFVETQPQSQPLGDLPEIESEKGLIGCLVPATENCPQFFLSQFKQGHKWTLGRNQANDLMVDGPLLSNFHCILTWNGALGLDCEVRLTNISSKGIWVDNLHLDNGHNALLQSGTSISLGQPDDLPGGYHYIYRDIEGQFRLRKDPVWRKYDMGQEIGSGTFATVYKCIERSTGKEHAVKIIDHHKLHCSHGSEKAAMREISILEKLSKVHHENVVGLREHFEGDDTLYLILELVQGGDLLSHIRTYGRMSESQVRRMTLQLCDAVAYIHSQGITHRDLKLENILVTNSDPPDFKVADFGVAKLVANGTILKTMCGTPAYIAPEVILDHPAYDNRVDSWGLGIIIYSMITNCSPLIEAPDPDAVWPRIYFDQFKIKWDILDALRLSATGKDFLRNLLVPDPRKRKTISDMLKHPWLTMEAGEVGRETGTSCQSGNGKKPHLKAGNKFSEQKTRPRLRRRLDKLAAMNQEPPRRSARLQALARARDTTSPRVPGTRGRR